MKIEEEIKKEAMWSIGRYLYLFEKVDQIGTNLMPRSHSNCKRWLNLVQLLSKEMKGSCIVKLS